MNSIMIGLDKVDWNAISDSNSPLKRKYDIIIENRNNYIKSINEDNIELKYEKYEDRRAIKCFDLVTKIRLTFDDKISLRKFSSSLFSVLSNNIIIDKSILNIKEPINKEMNTSIIDNNIICEEDYKISYIKDPSGDDAILVITFVENNTKLYLNHKQVKKLYNSVSDAHRDSLKHKYYVNDLQVQVKDDNKLRPEKNNYYLDIAEATLKRSTCLRRKYGAIIVKDDQIISTGYNGAPRGRKNCCDLGECKRKKMNIPSGERYELCRSVHAEANAIISAARSDMIGSTLYLVGKESDTADYVKDATCCSMCRRLIINAGIKQVCIRGTESLFYNIVDVEKEWINKEEI